MIQNYLKIAFRKLVRNKLYTSINVLGLALGMTAAGLIGLYTFEEWRVDRFHERGDRIYRVLTRSVSKAGSDQVIGTVGRPLATTIANEVPEVEQVIPVRRANFPVKINGQFFYADELYAGEQFLSTFSFPLREGNPQTALRDPYSLVLTESKARAYFGDRPAMGQILTLGDSLAFTVTGVLADPPPSHLNFQILLSLSTFKALGGERDAQWFTWDEYCYVLLSENADKVSAERKISALSMRHNGDQYRNNGYEVSHELEAVPSIHLHSEAGGVNRATGSAKQLYLIGTIGLFILLLACINFVNLTTAQQTERAKEVGVRKTVGAPYGTLIAQFIGESLLLSFLAGVLALLLMVIGLPWLNQLTEKNIPLSVIVQPQTLLVALSLIALTGASAGWYPALLLARFRPVETIKGRFVTVSQGTWLRQGLVVFQFAITIMLLVGTFVVFRQLNYLQRQNLGFSANRVLVIETSKTPRRDFYSNYDALKQQLQQLPNVQVVSSAAALPGRDGWQGQLVWPEGRDQEQALTFEVIPIDQDYAKTLDLKIISGRDYSRQFATDAQGGVLLNEAACKAIGWTPDEAVGKTLETSGLQDGHVIGVMADYHQHGLQQAVSPVLTFVQPGASRYLALKLDSGDLPGSVSSVQQFWQTRFPGYPFEYFFLDDDFNKQYQAQQRLSDLLGGFAGLAILIACLGLFGLATFTAEQRTKEIGVRKVLGASVASIVALLSKDFLKLVLVAIIIASPIAWYAMNAWLADFAYRVDISWWVFALAGGLAVGIALLTVSFQSVKAALMNPVESLRSE